MDDQAVVYTQIFLNSPISFADLNGGGLGIHLGQYCGALGTRHLVLLYL